MPFGRFFGRKDEPPPAEEADDSAEIEAYDREPESSPEDAPPIDWRARAAEVIPGGSSTGSKRPVALWGSGATDAPTHFVRASGCRVTDVDGYQYVDLSMSLGAVALGYAEPETTRAAVEAALAGAVSGLADVREVELAERLCDRIPCAERARFLKSGAEGVSAAVRIARTYTGRDRVVGSGYFGWHDWSSDANGVPAAVRAGYERVPFDDVAALERSVAAARGELAAIVLEPVQERLPSEAWIARARALATEHDAVLVFDEVKTGFRLRTGGYQELSGVTPDLAVFGKAMANGWPLAAVVGQAELMASAERTWISSTLAGEGTALAAALAVIDWHDKAEICETLAETGAELRAAFIAAIAASGVSGVSVVGLDPMFLLRWDAPERETRFLRLAAREGLLVKRGAYNFAAVAHDVDVVREVEAAASAACVALLRDEEAPA